MSTDTIRLLNEALGGDPRKVEQALASVGSSGGSKILTVATGANPVSDFFGPGLMFDPWSFSLADAGVVRLDINMYCGGNNGTDFCFAISDDSWVTRTLLDPYESEPLPAWCRAASKGRTINTIYNHMVPILAIVDLEPGDYEVGVWKVDSTPSMSTYSVGTFFTATLY